MHSDPELRADYLQQQKFYGCNRTAAELIEHYVLEKRLAEALKASPQGLRQSVYGEVYAELYRALPHHPTRINTEKSDRIDRELRRLRPLLKGVSTYLEIGCGAGRLTFEVAVLVKEAIGLDVTDALINYSSAPSNFRFSKTDGININLPDNSVDIVYSNSLIEHLHPDDVLPQMREALRVLKPGGKYYCQTPNRVTGPHDISRYFGDLACGFHLREYDNCSLADLFRRAGYRSARSHLVIRGIHIVKPYWLMKLIEGALDAAPSIMRRRLARSFLVSILLNVDIVATK